MNRVKVIYYGLIFSVTGNHDEEIDLPGEATIRGLLELLAERYGDRFRDNILSPYGEIQPHIVIQLNDRDITEINGIDTKLDDDNKLSITVLAFPVTGG